MIRAAREADVPAILHIYGPYVRDTTASFEYEIPSESEFLQRFQTITQQFPWLVWEENGTVLGYAYASAPYTRAAYAWCAEPSIYLAPEAQGKEIGKKLYEALEKILFLQGYQVLYALITEENSGSLRFHEKMGYVHRVTFPRCGYKKQRWLGLVWMEKRLNFVENPSISPTPWPDIRHCNEFNFHILDTLPLS